RNATLILNYAGKRLLVDPFFAPQHALPSFAGVSQNPTVDLPMPIEEITAGTDAVFVTHTHGDHFGPVAQDKLDKLLPLFCQPVNADAIREAGFTAVTPVDDETEWEGITITRTGGHHGRGGVTEIMGPVSGFVLRAKNEPTLYIVGDSVLVDEVRESIRTHNPDIIVTNSGGAMWDDPDNPGERTYILMDATETIKIARFAPGASIVAVHMEALDHCTVTRAELRAAADAAGVPPHRIIIPAEGEFVAFQRG
ncbi:MAG: MBL fold metallo-hydrolase, partial [Chloroflexota bacterium]